MNEHVYVYYHIDFDGVLSAALVCHLLKGLKFKPELAKPLEYVGLEEWQDKKIEVNKPFAIVDYPYRDDAFVYFDHHAANKPKEISDKTKYWAFEGNAKSCASIIYELLPKEQLPGEYKELIRWCDIIDSASFAENKIPVKDVLYPKKPALILNKALETARRDFKIKFWNSLVEKLVANPSLDVIINDEEIREYYKTAIKKQEIALKSLEENSSMDKKGIVSYDTVGKEWNRYGLYHIYPDSVISIGIRSIKKDVIDVSIGQNPWNPKNPGALERVHAGDILKEYGGGGHKLVGSAPFSSYEAAKTAFKEIKERIEKLL